MFLYSQHTCVTRVMVKPQLPGPHPERKYTEGRLGILAVARREV